MRVVIAGGGTAGHVFPAVALARRLAEAHGADVRFVGTSTGVESRLVPAAGFAFSAVEARPLTGRGLAEAVAAPAVAIRSVLRCRPIVADADVVVGVGGYVSAPAVLAAARARRPIVLHEQNAIPGLANRLLSRFARQVGLSFLESRDGFPRRTRGRTVMTGNPVREQIARVRRERDPLRKEAAVALGLSEGRRTVVVFGGSQGALSVNRAASAASAALAARDDLQILLLTGPAHLEMVRGSLREGTGLLVRAAAFLERMELAYAIADLVVARSGATTVAEVTCCGLPAIFIPYPHHRDRQQERNARAVQRFGGADLLLESELSAGILAARIGSLIDDPIKLASMGECAAAWGRPDAAEAMASVVVEAAA